MYTIQVNGEMHRVLHDRYMLQVSNDVSWAGCCCCWFQCCFCEREGKREP